MKSEKVQKFKQLTHEIYQYYWDKYECLPDSGSGPLNARIIVVAINPNVPTGNEEKYRQKWCAPFLLEDKKKLNYKKIEQYNQIYMDYFTDEICEDKVKEQLNSNFSEQFKAMKGFKSRGEYSDRMGPALKKIFMFATCSFDEAKLKKLIRTGIYYTNAVKRPTHKSRDLGRNDWDDSKEFLKEEIDLIDPKVILCLGVCLHELRDDLFGNPKQHCGDWPVHFKDEAGRDILFMYHFTRNWFFRNDHHKNFVKIANEIDLFNAMDVNPEY